MKTKIAFIMVFFLPLYSSADPFMGEGKKGYVDRCIKTAKIPSTSAVKKDVFCVCLANKLEAKYSDVLRNIKQTDSIAVAQQKMVNAAQAAARQCM